jgi:hypothetical protein
MAVKGSRWEGWQPGDPLPGSKAAEEEAKKEPKPEPEPEPTERLYSGYGGKYATAEEASKSIRERQVGEVIPGTEVTIVRAKPTAAPTSPILKVEKGIRTIYDPRTKISYREGTAGYEKRIVGSALRVVGGEKFFRQIKETRARFRREEAKKIKRREQERLQTEWFQPFRRIKPEPKIPIERIVFRKDKIILLPKGAKYYDWPPFYHLIGKTPKTIYHPKYGKMVLAEDVRGELEKRGVPLFPKERIGLEEKILLEALKRAEKVRTGKRKTKLGLIGRYDFFKRRYEEREGEKLPTDAGTRLAISEAIAGPVVTGYVVKKIGERQLSDIWAKVRGRKPTKYFPLVPTREVTIKKTKTSFKEWSGEYAKLSALEKIGYTAVAIPLLLSGMYKGKGYAPPKWTRTVAPTPAKGKFKLITVEVINPTTGKKEIVKVIKGAPTRKGKPTTPLKVERITSVTRYRNGVYEKIEIRPRDIKMAEKVAKVDKKLLKRKKKSFIKEEYGEIPPRQRLVEPKLKREIVKEVNLEQSLQIVRERELALLKQIQKPKRLKVGLSARQRLFQIQKQKQKQLSLQKKLQNLRQKQLQLQKQLQIQKSRQLQIQKQVQKQLSIQKQKQLLKQIQQFRQRQGKRRPKPPPKPPFKKPKYKIRKKKKRRYRKRVKKKYAPSLLGIGRKAPKGAKERVLTGLEVRGE